MEKTTMDKNLVKKINSLNQEKQDRVDELVIASQDKQDRVDELLILNSTNKCNF
jgi:hypothetical protein